MDNTLDYRELFEDAPCAYLVLDPQGRIIACNRTLRDWLGYDIDELNGKRLLDLLNVAGRIFYETHFAPLLRMQDFFHEVALDLMRKDGVKLPVLANAIQVKDGTGQVVFTRIALFQAAERRRYERELLEAQREAEATRRTLAALNKTLTETGLLRDEFMAVLGHDLRNPLAAIGGGMRILSREELPVRAKRVVALVEESVARMNGLIDDVLDLARGRLGGGLAVSRETTTDLPQTLEHVVAELVSATGRDIRAQVDLLRPVAVDRARLAQMASNLLGNAIAHGAPDGPIVLKARTDDGVLTISVSNQGEAIRPETMERLFQPFFRGGDAAGRQQGLGLGLHIASEIAKAHGGELLVSSDSRETVFTFRMSL